MAMNILGQYPRGHRYSIRVNYLYFKIRDCVVIDFNSYTIIEVELQRGSKILLDRPLERATGWHRPIMFDNPRTFEMPFDTINPYTLE